MAYFKNLTYNFLEGGRSRERQGERGIKQDPCPAWRPTWGSILQF